MGLIAKDKGGGDYTPIPEGLHHAICYGIWDIGTHHNVKFNKWEQKCIIVWELPEERGTFDGKNLPRACSRKFTVSLGEKADLRKLLETWRGRKFTDEEKQGFDIRKLLGANGMIQILHEKKADKTYANVVGITMLPKGIEKKEAENPLTFFSFEDGGPVPENTPKWIKDHIMGSKEMADRDSGPDHSDFDHGAPPDDDIPF
jgi:hypothetical protein